MAVQSGSGQAAPDARGGRTGVVSEPDVARRGDGADAPEVWVLTGAGPVETWTLQR